MWVRMQLTLSVIQIQLWTMCYFIYIELDEDYSDGNLEKGV